MPKESYKDSHKHDYKQTYRQEYLGQLQTEIRVKMEELSRLVDKLNRIDAEFEKWYKMYFPDGG